MLEVQEYDPRYSLGNQGDKRKRHGLEGFMKTIPDFRLGIQADENRLKGDGLGGFDSRFSAGISGREKKGRWS